MNKKFWLLTVMVILFLAGCGEQSNNQLVNNTKTVNDVLSAQMQSSSVQSEDGGITTTVQSSMANSTDISDVSVDVDLTKLSSTLVYSEVYNMLTSPDDYIGKTIKMSGDFAVGEGEDRYYFACIIADATACCSQGIEFLLDGDYNYPEDYPELSTEITVIGVFDTYYEGESRYCQLINASMVY